MAFRVEVNQEVKAQEDSFTSELRRAWNLKIGELIVDPFPRQAMDFWVTNQFGDVFYSFVVDAFPFQAQYDVVAWSASEPNPLNFDGKVKIVRLVPLDPAL